MRPTKKIKFSRKNVTPQNEFEELEANNFLIFILLTLFFVFTTKFTINDYGLDIDSNKFLNFLKFNTLPVDNPLSLILYKVFFALSPFIFITISELFLSNFKGYRKIFSTSLYKLRKSEGFAIADFWYFFIQRIIFSRFPFFILFITLGFSDLLSRYADMFSSFYEKFLPLISSSSMSIVNCLLVSFAILLSDFLQYVNHRINHQVPFMWDMHEFHHSATEMTIFNIRRETPLEKIPFAWILIPFRVFSFFLINYYVSSGFFLPVFILLLYASISIFLDYLGHSSIKVILPKPLSYIFMSPSLHWLHHSTNPKHHDCNFGQMFTIWDKLFGTYLGEEHIKEIESFGVLGTNYNKYNPIYSMVVLPVKKLTNRLNYLFN